MCYCILSICVTSEKRVGYSSYNVINCWHKLVVTVIEWVITQRISIVYIYTSFCKNHLILQPTLLIHCFKMCVWASIYWWNSETLAQPIRKLKSLFCCFLVHSYFFRFTGNPWIFDHFWTYYFIYVVAYRSTRPLYYHRNSVFGILFVFLNNILQNFIKLQWKRYYFISNHICSILRIGHLIS